MSIFKETIKAEEQSFPCYVPVTPTPRLNISDLTELICVKLQGQNDYYLFRCEPKSTRDNPCPYCESYSYNIHGYSPDRLVRDINMGEIRVDIKLKTPRYQCQDCGKTYTHQFESIRFNQQFTIRLYEQIKHESLIKPFASLSEQYGLSITKVADIFKEYAEEELKDYKVVAPRVLGIDEKHIVHQMRGVFVDIEQGKLLEMTPNNKKQTMIDTIKTFDGYDTNIKIVTIDMSCGYYSMISELLPNATVVIDKYHVIQDFGRCVNATKKAIIAHTKEELNKIQDEDERNKKLKMLTAASKNTYLFKYKEENLPNRSVVCMADVSSTFPMLNSLRLIRSAFYRIYDSENRQEAMHRYKEWVNLIPKHPVFAEMKKFKKTVDRWIVPIFNYFESGCQYTNAATEGINSLIDHINKAGRGYGFEALRFKCLCHPKPQQKYSKRNLPSYDFNTNTTYNFSLASRSYSSIDVTGFFPIDDAYLDSNADTAMPVETGVDVSYLLKVLNDPNKTFL